MRTRPTETKEGSSDLTWLFREESLTFEISRNPNCGKRTTVKFILLNHCSWIEGIYNQLLFQIFHPVDVDTALEQTLNFWNLKAKYMVTNYYVFVGIDERH